MVLAVVAMVVKVDVEIMELEGVDDTVAAVVAKNRSKRLQLGEKITLIC